MALPPLHDVQVRLVEHRELAEDVVLLAGVCLALALDLLQEPLEPVGSDLRSLIEQLGFAEAPELVGKNRRPVKSLPLGREEREPRLLARTQRVPELDVER